MDPQIGLPVCNFRSADALPVCNFRSAADDHDDGDDDGPPVVAVDGAVGVGVVAHNIARPVPLLHAASWCWNLRGQLTSIEDNNEGVPDCVTYKK